MENKQKSNGTGGERGQEAEGERKGEGKETHEKG